MVYDGVNYRTPIFKDAIDLICTTHRALKNKKMGQGKKIASKSHLVELVGVEPTSKQGTRMLSTSLAYCLGFRLFSAQRQAKNNLAS